MLSCVSIVMRCSQSTTLRPIPGARGALRRYLPPCPPGSGFGRLPIMRMPRRPDRDWRSSTQRPSLPDPLSHLRMGSRRKGISRMAAGSIDAGAALGAMSLRAAPTRKKLPAIRLPGKGSKGSAPLFSLSKNECFPVAINRMGKEEKTGPLQLVLN